MLAAACSSPDETETGDDQAGSTTEPAFDGSGGADGTGRGTAPAATDPAPQGPQDGRQLVELSARPGLRQLTIDAVPDGVSADAVLEITGPDGDVLAQTGFADNGTALIRELPEGPIEIELIDGEDRYRAEPMTIPGETTDGTSFADPAAYGRTQLVAGFNYIPTRDGTTLSAFVTLPGPESRGPFPTIVEYSGYSPSDPTAAGDPYRSLLPALGYAVVQVNVRGTGCSGGSFDAFERIQSLDGYDVIETVAAQQWSTKVGMFGVSYPGIMQLHVASTRPPSLAAIVPLSVTDGVDSVLYPGGIFNNGFGQNWTRQVSERARANGQPWAADRVADGDQICADNQRLRLHNPDLVDRIRTDRFNGPFSIARSARTYADQIEVPTLLAGAWQDEQTGGRFPALIEQLGNTAALRAIMYNGLHNDSISGELLVRIIEFLNLYVGDRPATVDPLARFLIENGLSAIFGTAIPLPTGRYDGLPVAEARARFESEPPIEVLFDQGSTAPNLPVPAFRARFEAWPPAATTPTEFYVGSGPGGLMVLDDQPPSQDGAWTFVTDPTEGQEVTVTDPNRLWGTNPGWV
jgi:pimeloyl-ACP methyl ester carboxylesterase